MPPSFVKSLIGSTMDTSNYIQSMRENVQKMQDIATQRQNEEDDRQRNLAMISYKAHSDVLSDPERYKDLSDDEIAKYSGSVLASQTTLKKLGVDMPGVDDPMPGAIAQEVWELQTDPKWRMQTSEDRYDHMAHKYGKHFYRVEASYINQEKLSRMTTPTQQVTNQSDIDSAAKTNTDLISNTLSSGNGPTKIDLVNVPAEIKTSIPGMDAKIAKSKAIFDDYSDVGILNPKQAAEMLTTGIANYARASQNPNTPPAMLDTMKNNLLAWSRSAGAGLTSAYIDSIKYSEPQMTPGQKAQDERATLAMTDKHWTQKWNQIKDITKASANFMDAQARTKSLRQELWGLEIKRGDHPEGTPMPNGFASLDPVTAAQRESAKMQAQQLAFQQGKSTEQFEYDYARMEQSNAQFDARMEQSDRQFNIREDRQNNPDQPKPDKFGRDTMAVASALSPAEQAYYGRYFSVETVLHAPDRIRKHWAAGESSKGITTDGDGNVTISDALKAEFAQIDKEEKQRHGGGGAASTNAPIGGSGNLSSIKKDIAEARRERDGVKNDVLQRALAKKYGGSPADYAGVVNGRK